MINLKSTYNLYLFILFFVTLFLSHPWECHSSKNNKKNGTSKNILFPLCQVVLNIFCSSLPQWSLHLRQTPPGLPHQPVCGELFLQSPEHFSVCGSLPPPPAWTKYSVFLLCFPSQPKVMLSWFTFMVLVYPPQYFLQLVQCQEHSRFSRRGEQTLPFAIMSFWAVGTRGSQCRCTPFPQRVSESKAVVSFWKWVTISIFFSFNFTCAVKPNQSSNAL